MLTFSTVGNYVRIRVDDACLTNSNLTEAKKVESFVIGQFAEVPLYYYIYTLYKTLG